MNLDDKSLFLGAMEDVQPLKRGNDVHWHPERNPRPTQRLDVLQLDNFLTTGYLDILPLTTPLEFKREGLQNGVLDKLRLGKYDQQASLNLLRRPVEQCRQMLFAFVVQAQKEGLRNLLIVHGKGRKITRTLISCVAIWRAGWSNCPRYRRSARPRHSMAAAERVTSRCANPPRRNRRTGSATPNAAASAAAASAREPLFAARVEPVPACREWRPARHARRRSARPVSGPAG